MLDGAADDPEDALEDDGEITDLLVRAGAEDGTLDTDAAGARLAAVVVGDTGVLAEAPSGELGYDSAAEAGDSDASEDSDASLSVIIQLTLGASRASERLGAKP
jgi:hypothetical protein